jgi:PAS domain S-box-containing protein
MMKKPLAKAIQRNFLTVTPETTIQEVITLLSQTHNNDCELFGAQEKNNNTLISSCVLVIENKKLLGIVTERDLVKIAARNKNVNHTAIKEVMTTNVITLEQTKFQDIFAGLNLLKKHKIRHLPIVDDQGYPVGLVTHNTIRKALSYSDLLSLKRVHEVMQTNVIYARANDSLQTIAELMAKNSVSCIVIIENRHLSEFTLNKIVPIGIITERDIVQFKSLELTLDKITAKTVMSQPLFTVKPEDSLVSAAQKMEKYNIRRLVVINDHEQLAGILTQTNIVRILDPVEMYETLEILQSRITELETEKSSFLNSHNQQLKKQLKEKRIKLKAKVNQSRLLYKLVNYVRKSLQIKHQKMETEFKNLEDKWRFLLEASPNLIISLDREGNILFINRAIPGLFPEELQGKSLYNLIPMSLINLRKSQLDKVWNTGESLKYETEKINDDQSISYYQVQIAPILQNHQIINVILVATDITELKKYQLALKYSEEKLVSALNYVHKLNQELEKRVLERTTELINSEKRFRHYFEFSLIGITIISVDKKLLEVNDKLCEILGYTREELSQMDWKEITYPDDLRASINHFNQMMAGEIEVYETEKRFIRKDKQVIFTSISSKCLRKENGEIDYFITLIQDITQRKQAEQNLLELNTLQQGILNGADYAIIATDINGIIHTFNTGAEKLLGYKGEELIGKHTPIVFHDLEEVINRAKQLSEELGLEVNPGFNVFIIKSQLGLPDEQEWTYIRKDKSRIMVLLSITALRNSKGEINGFLGIAKDISDRKKIEAEKQQLISIIQSSTDLINIYSLEGKMLFLNPAGLQMLNISTLEQAQKTTFLEYITGQDLGKLKTEIMPEVLKKGFWKGEFRVLNYQNKKLIPVDFHVFLLRETQTEKPFAIATITRDITERKQAEKALQKSEAKFKRIFASNIVGMVFATFDGKINDANDRFLEMIGYNQEDLQSGILTCDTITAIEYKESDRNNFKQLLETGTVKPWEKELIRKDGSGVFILVAGSSLTGEKNEFVAIILDINEQKKAQMQLQTMNKQLISVNAELARITKLKDEFLANMSHELRTPLNAILGMSEGMQEEVFGGINPQQSKAMNTIEKSAKHLLALINDILDLSKIEAGKLALQIETIAVQNICENSMILVNQMAQKKSIEIGYKIDDNINYIQADERRIEQILINLLSNAVKFTPNSGKVTLEVKLKAEQILFIVKDTGIGIAPENINKLFESFVQIDSSLNRQYTGTGLGLALVRTLTELHSGIVTVESELGKGSCFTVALPYQKKLELQPADIKLQTISEPKKPQIAPLILLVEDQETNTQTIADYLITRGYRLITANNGEIGVNLAEQEKPNLIIMDICMPIMDGLETTKRIRQTPAIAHTPIIALTARAMSEDEEKCFVAGVNKYLTKPVQLKQLVNVIEQLLTTP